MSAQKLPFSKQLAYAAGMMGWSIMTNIIIVMINYFYLAPSKSGLVPLMPQIMVFLGVNIMSIILASVRLVDAFYDPFLASLSDKSKNPKGRRIPFMKYAILPAVVFCCLTFRPLVIGQSLHNAWWLVFTLVGFFMSSTSYIIPYNALLPELTDTAKEKVKLSSFQQIGFVLGMIFSALVNNFADLIEHFGHINSRVIALQYTIWGLCIFAGLVMLIPIFAIDEKKYSSSTPSHLPLFKAVRATFSNRNFKYYLISDFSYYMAISIISSGLLFFITVLLHLPESMGGLLVGVMVLVSVMFYPFVNFISARFGKKPLVLISFLILALVYVAIYFLGLFPVSAKVQIYTLVIFAAFPLAALGILPNAILAEIAEADAIKTGENREGMFFAVKYLFVKLGQTSGTALFAFLTIYGIKEGHDYGLRLNGICGFVLCLLALMFFSRFREVKPNRPAK
ncbi:GPH family glycoside/pentoside/hexuronide:cation symporter [Mucilaginibacter gracilis]|uniref:GPH family glycoside/pentoside/hexuronide:cation symporter n=1 Tax=Mucilaginibacter gracilis TaxID=423350 RepID=A0A495J902_9SPHI|nr:MFS transporter [Mucilaginibacter gracilis]RKR85490.1 GPH family glycoside/pentoside/hexuronide:cation symporter [Mucilaginibacter gracilis]